MRNALVAIALCLTFAGARAGPNSWAAGPDPLAVLNTGFAPSLTLESREAVQQALAAGQPLAGADLSGLPLAGLDFEGLDLEGTKWFQADLRGARFTQCQLQRANFTAAYVNGAVFRSCQLQEAVFTGAVLAGGYFSTCDISGAVFTDAKVGGVTLEDVTLFPTGAAHLPAIRDAIRLRGGPPLSPAWLAAVSGDAFAFTYDQKERAAWPGTPMTFNPIVLAAETLGYDVTYKASMESADGAGKELTAILRRGLVAVLPMRLAGGGLDGNAVAGAVWVAAHDMQRNRGNPETVLVHTPFGPMEFAFEDLLNRWRGPWPTLLPAGEAPFAGEFPLCTIGAQKAEYDERAVALTALRHASAIMNEPRSFASLSGGFAAYDSLIQDFSNSDVEVADLIHWSGVPRRALSASRNLAATFLTEAGPKLPEASQTSLSEAAALYKESALLLRDEWPLPAPEAFEGEKAILAVDAAASRRPHARAVLEEAVLRERRAVALLGQAVAEAVRAP